MDYDYNDRKQASVYSRRLKAGKRRTYFFDVRETRGNDFFLTITESRKRFNEDGYDRHKIFLYKEDFNKFLKALGEAVDHVKTELMPDYDFDSFSHEGEEQDEAHIRPVSATAAGSYKNDNQNNYSEQGATSVTETAPALKPAPGIQTEPDASTIEAETIHSQSSDTEIVTNTGEDIVNATETSDKLASEEVEKW